jgi:shikimate kinase
MDHRNIVLIGHRCSGKSAVGERLAEALGRPFVDTDRRIEGQAGCAINTLVLREGWPHFRALEAQVIRHVAKSNNLVIATGGGSVLDENNVRHLKANGIMVWLKADAAVLSLRLERDPRSRESRPSLTGGDLRGEISEMLRKRRPCYESVCDLSVNTSHLNINDVTESIIGSLKKPSVKRSRVPWAEILSDKFSG